MPKRAKAKRKVASQKDAAGKMQRAVAVAQVVQIRDVVLQRLECESNLDRHSSGELSADARASARATRSSGADLIYVDAVCSLHGSQEGEEPAITIDARFRISYSVPATREFSPADLDAFAEINGLFNVWPFWRELVQSLTVRMGLPALTLPVRRGVSVPAKSLRKAPTSAKH